MSWNPPQSLPATGVRLRKSTSASDGPVRTSTDGAVPPNQHGAVRTNPAGAVTCTRYAGIGPDPVPGGGTDREYRPSGPIGCGDPGMTDPLSARTNSTVAPAMPSPVGSPASCTPLPLRSSYSTP